MKTLVVASLLGILIWCAIATNVTPPKSQAGWYRPTPAQPARYDIPCEERQFVCRARKRMEKIKGKEA